jgi:hypothetical protein
MRYQQECELFLWKVEDYTVNLIAATADTAAPTAPSSLTASGHYYNHKFILNASSDNVAVTGYDVIKVLL